MSINIEQTNGIVAELQVQRNEALNQAAVKAGHVAELKVALAASQKLVAELEAQLNDKKPEATVVPMKKPNGKANELPA